jgi:hypothetical protein
MQATIGEHYIQEQMMAAVSNKPNLRRAPRFQATPKGELSDGATSVLALIQDISDEGFLLVCSKEFPVGTVLGLKIQISPNSLLDCAVEVRHSSDMGTGVKILSMNEHNRRVYERYLQEYFSHQLGKLG